MTSKTKAPRREGAGAIQDRLAGTNPNTQVTNGSATKQAQRYIELPSAMRLRQLITCDGAGRLVARMSRGNRAAGMVLGTTHQAGYLQVFVDRVAYQAVRLALVLHHGTEPNGAVRPVNGDWMDHRAENLREVKR